jgi:hypothetical protein
MAVKPVPEGYHTITPYLVVRGAGECIEFLKQAFGAEETFRMPMPGDKVGHAELRFGDSVLMIADESPEAPARQAGIHGPSAPAPKASGRRPTSSTATGWASWATAGATSGPSARTRKTSRPRR